MSLAQISRFPSFLTLKKKNTSNKFDLLTKSLDESVLRGIKSLRNEASVISLSWLSSAVDFLSTTHTEAMNLISNFKLSTSLELSSCYLDDSVKILDLCNSIHSEIERLKQRRLLINLVLHLLSDSDPVKVQRAKNLLSDSSFSFGSNKNIQHLVKDLAVGLENGPRGKISTVDNRVVRRTIHAVGLVTVFVAGVLVSAFYGSGDFVAVRVPSEFLWADSFNGLQSTISTELNRRFGGEKKNGYLVEIDDVEACKSKLCDVIDDVEGNDKEEKLSNGVKELEKAMEKFSEGLDQLSNGVNGMFQTVLCSRNAMMENLREPTK